MNSESCFGVFFRLCVLPQCIFTQKTCIDNGCESPSEKYDDLENTGFIEDLLQSLGVSFSELLGFGVEDDCAATPFLSSCDMRVSLSKKSKRGGNICVVKILSMSSNRTDFFLVFLLQILVVFSGEDKNEVPLTTGQQLDSLGKFKIDASSIKSIF